MKKIFFVTMLALLSIPAFAGTMGIIEAVKPYATLENALAAIGTVSVVMTGVPVPKAGTWLYKLYTVLKYFGGNFGFADHTKKQ